MAKCITCLHLYKPPPRFTNTWGAASGTQAVDLQARASEVAAKDPGPLGHGWGGERGPSRPQPGTVPFDCVFVSCPRAALGSPLRPGRPAPRGWRRLCLPTPAHECRADVQPAVLAGADDLNLAVPAGAGPPIPVSNKQPSRVTAPSEPGPLTIKPASFPFMKLSQ